jgi:Fe-Mn family superoxide dismutase
MDFLPWWIIYTLNMTMYNFIKWTLNEGKTPKTLEQLPLPYKKDALEPSISEDTINYHYGKLYKAYVTRFNNGEGDADFNEAGAFLHHILFEQYQEPTSSNQPDGPASEFITKHFKTFDQFKDTFFKEAMKIQGSGWAYLSRDGKIKTIANHEIKMDIVLLIDWWEHAFALDYQADKKGYLANQWKIINWNVISSRVGLAS